MPEQKVAKNAKGKLIPLREGYRPLKGTRFGATGKPNALTGNNLDVIGRFGRTKLAPVPSLVADVLNRGENVVGEPLTPESVAKGLVVPLSLQDINQTMNEQGVPMGAALGVLSIFGMGLQNYDDKKKTP